MSISCKYIYIYMYMSCHMYMSYLVRPFIWCLDLFFKPLYLGARAHAHRCIEYRYSTEIVWDCIWMLNSPCIDPEHEHESGYRYTMVYWFLEKAMHPCMVSGWVSINSPWIDWSLGGFPVGKNPTDIVTVVSAKHQMKFPWNLTHFVT